MERRTKKKPVETDYAKKEKVLKDLKFEVNFLFKRTHNRQIGEKFYV